MASWKPLFVVFSVSLATSGFGLSANANDAAFITFDVPGAQGTFAVAINAQGTITGQDADSGGVVHGFVRAPGGTFVTFDVPGASTESGFVAVPWGINPAGTTTGWWYDNTPVNGHVGLAHGFVRAPDGAITKFAAPGASQTWAFDINAAGTVAGYYNAGVAGGSDLFRGFIRAPGGAITTFAAPGAGTGNGQGTQIPITNALNPAGAVTGYYLDASSVWHGFVRAPDAVIATFDAAGAGTGAFQGTAPQGISPEGGVTGYYQDTSNVFHGFVRAPDGAITTFDAPGAGTGAFQGTGPEAISPHGAITGNYADSGSVWHGFMRTADGAITTFDPPGSKGTFPISFNPAGAIVGYYLDASNVFHGFIRVP